MKILYLTTHLNIGGITTYLFTLLRGLKALGHECIVASSGGEMEKEFREAGIRCLPLDIKTKSELSPKVYKAIPKILRLVKAEKIDLIHAHTRVTQVLASYVSKLSGVPNISTVHGFYKRRLGRRIFPSWGKFAIAISKPVEEHLIDYFKVNPKNCRTITIHNALNLEELDARYRVKDPHLIRKELKAEEGSLVLGIIARIVEDKGHEFFLRAIKKLLPTYPKLKGLIVGEGPFKKKVLELSNQLNLNNNVLFLGNLTDVTRVLAIMDIFVLPALWREGFGLAIIEAMAAKKPVVVSNISALNVIIKDGVHGFLVRPRDTEDLVYALRKLIDNPELREKMGKENRRLVEEEFSLAKMLERVENVYSQILEL